MGVRGSKYNNYNTEPDDVPSIVSYEPDSYDTGYSYQIAGAFDSNPNSYNRSSTVFSRSNADAKAGRPVADSFVSANSANSDESTNSVKSSSQTDSANANKANQGPYINVHMYSSSNMKGEVFEIDAGNYPSDVFINAVSPYNVFSLTIPPYTTIKLFGGNEYDFGGKGGMSITNTGSDIMRIESLPSNISGQIRSVSIVDLKDLSGGSVVTDDKSAFTKTDRGELIASGMSMGSSRDFSKYNNNRSKFEAYDNMRNTNIDSETYNHNIASVLSYPEMVVLFYIFLLILVIYLLADPTAK